MKPVSAPLQGTNAESEGGDGLAAYFRLMEKMRPGRRPGNLRFYLSYLFDGIPLSGRSVLDVGAGDGRYSLYAATLGARRVVALEPEAAGSASGVAQRLKDAAGQLNLRTVELVPQTFQAYEPRGERFDVVLLNASINHLDEEACIRLHLDSAARSTYLSLFRRLAQVTSDGATIIVSDCGRRNLARKLPRSLQPMPWMDWDKHQEPWLWIDLLTKTGFEAPRLRWNTPNSLRGVGRILLGNRVAAYCTTSGFCLTMRRSAGEP